MKNRTGEKCPYWADGDANACNMTKGGLYIPMPGHIEMFCSTGRYGQCSQYLRSSEMVHEEAEKYGFVTGQGRRRYRRFAERIALSLFAGGVDAGRGVCSDDEAFSVDMSLGGLRMESRQQLMVDDIISLQFGSDFAEPGYSGSAQVCWCEAKKDEEGVFQAGIAFKDMRLSQAVGVHLGLPMM